jgi:hypothetical protein
MTAIGSPGHKKGHRRLRAAIDVVGAAMIAAGAVLVGISVSQHQHYERALAAHAARKAQVDRAAVAEAVKFRAQQVRAQRFLPATRPPDHRATASTKSTHVRPGKSPQLGARALVRLTGHRAAAGPARRDARPTRARPSAVTRPLGLFPVIAVHLAAGRVNEATAAAREMLDAAQLSVPDDLRSTLEAACEAWDRNETETADSKLAEALELAQDLDYF